MSMLGCSLIKKIDLRCLEAKPNQAHEPFGCLFIHLLEYIKQLLLLMDNHCSVTVLKVLYMIKGSYYSKTSKNASYFKIVIDSKENHKNDFKIC